MIWKEIYGVVHGVNRQNEKQQGCRNTKWKSKCKEKIHEKVKQLCENEVKTVIENTLRDSGLVY